MKSARVLAFISAIVLLGAALAAPRAFALMNGGGVAVIVNTENPVMSLSPQELRRIYTNNVLHWSDGTPIRLYDLVVQSPARGSFSEAVLGRSPGRVAEEWAHLKITNQAKNPPLTVKSERLIIKRVSRERGAIGYVSLDIVEGIDSVRVVATIE